MVQDFDFFLLLSALAVLLVLWLMVRTFRGTRSSKKSQNTINAKTGEIKAHRARPERIKSRKPQIEIPKEEKKPPRVTALIFTNPQSQPFAVIQLSALSTGAMKQSSSPKSFRTS